MYSHRGLIVILACFTVVLPTAAQTPAGPELTPVTLRQGDLARVRFQIPEGREVAKASVVFGGSTFPCFQRDGEVVGLFAVAARTKPGPHAATLWVRYEGGTTDRLPLSLTVGSAGFSTQSIRMPKSKTGLMSDEILAKEREILYSAMEKTAGEPLWEGVFANPVEGRISSPFGRTRYVNGRFWSQHSGRDVAAPTGRPVKATNRGRVLVAQKLWMRGNTVMIDHGMGVFSLYNHLSAIDVQEGEEVAKGQVIGKVGATGFATGPHLHWEIRVHRTPVNPAGPLAHGIALGE
ncbi:MAG: M23 family metallopeptidase [Armatimonadetes bacterium]|nr:M23 family metallopeptidase [Armatimonadota bacterium]